jgi:RNA 3'-terminal phosphate cyclase (ATP)
VGEDPQILLDVGDGDGGGHRLRTALALSCVTGRPFAVTRFRSGHPEPGLRPKHVQAALGAARLCGAEMAGCAAGSTRLDFRPGGPVRPVEGLELDAGPAGSTALLLQTVCWPLALAGGPSTLTLRGGTHQPRTPSFHFLALAWAPLAARLGFKVEVQLISAGFHALGGGAISARVEPARAMPPLDLRHRGLLREVEVLSLVGGLDAQVAELQAVRAARALRTRGVAAEVERLPLPVHGSSGSHVLVLAAFERLRSGHGVVAEAGRPPAEAAEAAVEAFQAHLDAGGAVDGLLADQLLLPAALLAAGLVPAPPGLVPATRFTVSEVTGHLLAAAAVIPRFLAVDLAVVGRPGQPGEVRVQPPGGTAGLLPLPPAGREGP